MIRIIYTLFMAFRHRKALSRYLHDPLLQAKTVLELNPIVLKTQGIKVMAIDFDGVLASHGEEKINPELHSWLNSCIQSFATNHVFILSNKPTEQRKQYFETCFPGLQFVLAKRKKPFPDGLNFIITSTQVAFQEVLVIDDRLFTGILAALLAKTRAILITNPYISLSKRPLQELFFMGMRKLERLCLP